MIYDSLCERKKVTIKCWARVKSRASDWGSNDAVGTRRETRRKLAEGIRSLLGVLRELAEGIRGLPGVHRKLAECIRSLLGVHWELTEGDRELARLALGVHRKKTKRLTGRSSGRFAKKFVESSLTGCWELTGSSLEGCWEFIESSSKEIKSSLGVQRKDAGSSSGVRREIN
ncbi:hypothetical protein BHE74_00033639 [Ensete ventricosum]|nr:hypothetical protein BHE74_00033639 [Ensete ventricosum]